MDIMKNLLDILLAVVIFGALFGFIITSINGVTWYYTNSSWIGGTLTGSTYSGVLDLRFAPYILVLLTVIGLVYLVYTHALKRK